MDRVIRDGKVAILYSPGFGAGWYSWHHIEELVFDPSIVTWLEARELGKIVSYLTLKYPGEYFGGVDQLTIKWIPQGTQFRIEEYDGAESVQLLLNEKYLTA
jgi:hypothetical protein